MARDVCEWKEPYHGSFVEVAAFIPIFIIFLSALFIHSIYHSFIKKGKTANVKKSLKILFLSQQLVALCWVTVDLLRFVIDPYTLILQDNILCDITSAAPKLLAFIYYGIYASLILYRLNTSFKGSFLEIKKTNLYILLSLIILPETILSILLILWIQLPCIWYWEPLDLNVSEYDSFRFCSFHSSGKVNVVIIFGIVWISITNIVFGIIFSVKLNKVLHLNSNDSNNKTQKQNVFNLKSLVLKNGILTIVGASSSILNWNLWLLLSNYGIGTMLLYLDLFINCICVGLMFNYMDMYYKKLCKMCIMFCLIKLDKGYDHTNKKQVEERRVTVNEYLSTKIVFDINTVHIPSEEELDDGVDVLSAISEEECTEKILTDNSSKIQEHVIVESEYASNTLPPIHLDNNVMNISHNNNNDRFNESVRTNNMYSNGNNSRLAQPIKQMKYNCKVCGGLIDGSWTEDAKQRMYHNQCFVCCKCGVSLISMGKYVTVGGGVVCKPCRNKQRMNYNHNTLPLRPMSSVGMSNQQRQ